MVLLEEVCHWGVALRLQTLVWVPVLVLTENLGVVDQDTISLLFFHSAIMDYVSWLWCFITAIEEELRMLTNNRSVAVLEARSPK